MTLHRVGHRLQHVCPERRVVNPRRVLTIAAGTSSAAVAVAAIGLALDGQVISGAPAWLKPLKFSISIAVYCATVRYLLGHVRGHDRLVSTLAWATGGSLGVELALIDLQVVRGTRSHFNTDTPFDGAVFAGMGLAAAVAFAAALGAAVLLCTQRLPQPLGAGLRGGLAVSVLGMAQGVLMLRHGGHTVGGPDGGPGWLFTGWSTQHGDLRIGHFIGLHALQVLIAGAWLLARTAPGLPPSAAARLVTAGALFYGGWVALLSWQAERAEPLAHPSPLVGTVAAAWTAAGLAAGWLLVRRSGMRRAPAARRT